MIRDMLEQFFESGEDQRPPNEEDPFWDPPEAVLIGTAYIKLESLAYVMDSEVQANIFDTGTQKNKAAGQLKIQYVPTTREGVLEIPDEDLPDEISDMRKVSLLKVSSWKKYILQFQYWPGHRTERGLGF